MLARGEARSRGGRGGGVGEVPWRTLGFSAAGQKPLTLHYSTFTFRHSWTVLAGAPMPGTRRETPSTLSAPMPSAKRRALPHYCKTR